MRGKKKNLGKEREQVSARWLTEADVANNSSHCCGQRVPEDGLGSGPSLRSATCGPERAELS